MPIAAIQEYWEAFGANLQFERAPGGRAEFYLKKINCFGEDTSLVRLVLLIYDKSQGAYANSGRLSKTYVLFYLSFPSHLSSTCTVKPDAFVDA